MAMDTDGKRVIDNTIDFYKKENARLQSEVDHLTHLLSGKPDFEGAPSPEFQRIWQACIGLSDKADFKFMFEMMHKMEKELVDKQKLINRLMHALCSHHYSSDCQCVAMGVTFEQATRKPGAP